MIKFKLVLGLLGVVAIAGCGIPPTASLTSTYSAPKFIKADKEQYFACGGKVQVTESSSGLLEIQFTDANGMDHDVRGIKKLELIDPPKNLKSLDPEDRPIWIFQCQ